MSFYDTSTAELTAVQLLNYDGSEILEIADINAEFSYYEDLNIPAVSAIVSVLDASGYLNRFPIIGNETLNLNFKTRGFDYLEGIDIQNMKSYNVGARVNISDRAVAYPIYFTTNVGLNDVKTTVHESYEGRISEIVRRISEKAAFDLPFAIEETDGQYHYVGTGDTVFETIKKLSKEAKSTVHKSSSFVFFQDRFGYKFVTLNSLFAQSVRENNDFYYSYQNRPNNEIPPNQLIKSLDFLKKSDVIDGMKNGLFGGETLSVDPIRKITNKTEFDYFGSGFKDTQPHLSRSRIQNTENSFARNSQVAHSNCIISDLKDISSPSYIQRNYPRQDSHIRRKHQFINEMHSMMEQSNNYGIEITIPGNSSLRVGDVINVNIPQPSAAKEDQNLTDKYLQGKYLISSARHIVDRNGIYETVLECIKDSFENEVEITT